MTEERDIEEDLKPSTGDYAHAGVRAGLSTAPFLGGPLAEFFSMVIAPPLEKRRDAWLIEIFTRLKMLEAKIDGFKIENLAQNKIFISTLLYATQAAMRTHQKEKLQALRNAVINSAILPSVDENLQLMFLNLVDRYTPAHLVILQLLDNQTQYGKQYGFGTSKEDQWETIAQLIEKSIPDLSEERPILMQILKDLSSDGLLTPDFEKRIHRPIDRASFSTTTKLGKIFLNFITMESSADEMIVKK